jgi:hypothetical protein
MGHGSGAAPQMELLEADAAHEPGRRFDVTRRDLVDDLLAPCACACGSSLTTKTAFSPAIVRNSTAAYATVKRTDLFFRQAVRPAARRRTRPAALFPTTPARVMDLVEHDERRPRQVVGEQVRRLRDLPVCDHDAVDVLAPRAVGVAPARIEVKPDAIGGVGPLRAQGRRAHDDDPLGPAHRLARCERLARLGRGHQQELWPRVRGMAREELGLPRPRRDHAGRAPFARLQPGHSRPPVRRLRRPACAHRLDMVGMPAGPQRLTAHRGVYSWASTLITTPCGSRTKKRRTPHGSSTGP